MKTVSNKNNFRTLSIFTIIDIIIIGGWTLYLKPSSDITIVYIFIIPFVFLLNLGIGIIIYFIKKYYTPFFIINAFISSFMLYFFSIWYIEINNKINYEEWVFSINNESYNISYNVNDTVYNVYVSCGEGCSKGYDRGSVEKKNDTIYFFSVDSIHYYIYKDYLYNFKDIDKMQVKKIY